MIKKFFFPLFKFEIFIFITVVLKIQYILLHLNVQHDINHFGKK